MKDLDQNKGFFDRYKTPCPSVSVRLFLRSFSLNYVERSSNYLIARGERKTKEKVIPIIRF